MKRTKKLPCYLFCKLYIDIQHNLKCKNLMHLMNLVQKNKSDKFYYKPIKI